MLGKPVRGFHRKRSNLPIIAGAFGLLAVIVVLITILINQNLEDNRPVAQEQVDNSVALQSVTLIAPTTQVPKGARITSAYLKEISWPRDTVPEGAVRSIQDIQNMYATTDLLTNTPILLNSVSLEKPTGGISDLLPPGSRAITISVDETSGVEGWATPGAHVDVYLTYLDTTDGINKTRVVVENAVVLSYGGSAAQVDSANISAVSVPKTVTLAVSFQDSLKIQTAKALGRLTLALRNAQDVKSAGEEVFAATEWDEPGQPQAPTGPKGPSKKGYASYTGTDGQQKEFVLGTDNSWYVNEEEEGL